MASESVDLARLDLETVEEVKAQVDRINTKKATVILCSIQITIGIMMLSIGAVVSKSEIFSK